MADEKPTFLGEREAAGEIQKTTETPGASFEILSVGELLLKAGYKDGLKSTPRPREWLFMNEGRGFIPRGHVGIIGGRGGTAKSTFALQAAISVVTASPVLQGDIREGALTYTKPKNDPERAFVCFAEEDLNDISERLFKLCKGLTKDQLDLVTNNLKVLSLRGKTAYLVDDQGKPSNNFNNIQKQLNDGDPWAFMVFDPLARFQRDAEKDASEATSCLAMFERLTALPGKPTVLVVHHATKGSNKDTIEEALSIGSLRGSGALSDAGRFQLMMANEKEECRKGSGRVEILTSLRSVKSNYGPLDFPTIKLKITEAGVRLATKDEIAALENLKASNNQKRDVAQKTKTSGSEDYV